MAAIEKKEKKKGQVMADPRKRYEKAREKLLKKEKKNIGAGTNKVLGMLNYTRKQVIGELADAPTDWKAYHLPQLKKTIEEQINNFKDQAAAEVMAQQDGMWHSGADAEDMILDMFEPKGQLKVVIPVIPTPVLGQMKEFSVGRIKGLSASAMEKIERELTLGILGAKTPSEVMASVGKNLKDPSIFRSIAVRAEVIVRNEMGRVYEKAKEQRRQEQAAKVPGLKKQWFWSRKPHGRITHMAADEQVRNIDEPFDVGGEELMYPQDPAGSPENTINCGCRSLPYKEDWFN